MNPPTVGVGSLKVGFHAGFITNLNEATTFKSPVTFESERPELVLVVSLTEFTIQPSNS